MTHEQLVATLSSTEARLSDLNRRRFEALHARYLGAEAGDDAALDAEEAAIRADAGYASALKEALAIESGSGRGPGAPGAGGRAADSAGPGRVRANLAGDPAVPDSDPLHARRIDLHRRRWLEAAVRTDPEAARRAAALHDQAMAFRPWLADGPARWADVREALRREPDRARREMAWFAGAPLAESVEADLVRLMTRRNELARSHGFDAFPRLAMEAAELPMLDFLSLCDELEPLTRPVYEQMLGWARETSGLEVLEPWDIEYLLATLEPPAADCPKESFAGAARGLAGAWGFDLDRLPIAVHQAELPFGGMALPVRIPDDVRLLVSPRDGLLHLEIYIHEHGHALHAAHMRPAVGAFEWEPEVFNESIAMLTEGLGTQRFMAGRPPKPSDAAWRMWRTVLRLRQLMALSVFEILAYEKPEADLHGLWCEVHENYLGHPRHPERLWAAKTMFITHPLYWPNYVAGRLIADQLSTWFFDRFGAVDRPEVGEILRRDLWAPAASTTWEEKLVAVTGRPLDPNGFLKETGIPDSV